jgi:hypothetical protein
MQVYKFDSYGVKLPRWKMTLIIAILEAPTNQSKLASGWKRALVRELVTAPEGLPKKLLSHG